MRKPKLVVIVGPTASGKSELAVRLAKKFNGEIIYADSRQIYRGLDIGTGKVSGKWKICPVLQLEQKNGICFLYQEIPHHCIDFVSPTRTYTVAKFKKCAEAAIRDIASRDKLSILAGGAGFWIDAVIYAMGFPAPCRRTRNFDRNLKKRARKSFFQCSKKSLRNAPLDYDKKGEIVRVNLYKFRFDGFQRDLKTLKNFARKTKISLVTR